jgi:hypothetical protein
MQSVPITIEVFRIPLLVHYKSWMSQCSWFIKTAAWNSVYHSTRASVFRSITRPNGTLIIWHQCSIIHHSWKSKYILPVTLSIRSHTHPKQTTVKSENIIVFFIYLMYIGRYDMQVLIYIFEEGPSWPWSYGTVEFTTIYVISAYHHWCCEFESLSGRGVQHYLIKFVSHLGQVGGFLWVLRFPLPIKLTTTI